MFKIIVFTLIPLIISFPGKNDVDTLISKKENSVRAICDSVRTYYTGDELTSTCDVIEKCQSPTALKVLEDSMDCFSGYGDDVECGCSGTSYLSRESSGVRYAQDTDKTDMEVKRFLCFSESLKTVYRDNYQNDNAISWQYIGSPKGAYNIWPLTSDVYSSPNNSVTCKTEENNVCSPYDPRIRPWYVSSASGPKDIVIVIDTSGSMNDVDDEGNRRIDLVKEAAKDVVNGLGIYDRLSIVFFNVIANTCAQGSYVPNGDTLIRATSNVKDQFKFCLEQMTPVSETNFGAGFTKAFDILSFREYDPNICHTAVLFLTDGISNRGMSGSELMDFLEDRNGNEIAAKIFTFSVGNGADHDLPKRIACAHKGIWLPITSGDNLRTKMRSYYDYFTYSNHTRGVTWSERYYDFSGLGWMVTVSQGCFSESGSLFGVAGVDVLISEFDAISNYTEYVADYLFQKYHICYDIELSEEQLEGMRLHKCSSTIGTIIAISVGIIASVVGVFIAFIVVGIILTIVGLLYYRSVKSQTVGQSDFIKHHGHDPHRNVGVNPNLYHNANVHVNTQHGLNPNELNNTPTNLQRGMLPNSNMNMDNGGIYRPPQYNV